MNHSAEQKTLGIPFRTVPQRRKMLGIPFRGKNRSKFLEFLSEACLGLKHAVYSVCWRRRIFCKTNFFHAIFFRPEPRNWRFARSALSKGNVSQCVCNALPYSAQHMCFPAALTRKALCCSAQHARRRAEVLTTQGAVLQRLARKGLCA
jgi:hypothetical protein